jgi:hypothetical protein
LTFGSVNKRIVTDPPIHLTRYAPPDKICHGKIVKECIRGNKDIDPKILIVGDSHAAQLNLSFDSIGNSSNLAFKVITASSCVTIPGFDVERLPKWARQSCLDQIDFVKDLISNYKQIVIAGMWSYHTESKKFMDSLDLFLGSTIYKDIDVIVIAQIPMFKSNPLRLQRFNYLNLPTKPSLDENWRDSNQLVQQITENYPNVTFVDFSNIALFDKAPFYDKELIYRDTHHLNEVGAIKYGQSIRSEIIRLLNIGHSKEE